MFIKIIAMPASTVTSVIVRAKESFFVVVCGGVTIGEGCVIGAGSVVTRDIPPYSLAAGNPCRVIRKITEKDHM